MKGKRNRKKERRNIRKIRKRKWIEFIGQKREANAKESGERR